MEETNFVLLWKEQYEKIDESLQINRQILKELTSQKASSMLHSLTRFKTRGIVAAILYLIILGLALFYAISNYSSAANYFIISIGAIFIINLKALADYIKHLVWIHNIDYNGSITDIQSTLTELQLSIFQHSRWMVLQLPFWSTFYLSNKWFPYTVSWAYVIFQIVFTLLFAAISIWLYKIQTIENANNKWVKLLIQGSGGKSVAKAIEFYKELESFKQP
jgi:hypothetical protein